MLDKLDPQKSQYVHAHAFGEVRQGDKTFEIDDKWASDLKEGFDRLTSHNYFPPVLRAHKGDGDGKEPRPVRDGFSYGRVVDVVSSRESRAEDVRESDITSPDEDGIWFGLELPQGVLNAQEKGYIQNWSPSFYRQWQPPHSEMAQLAEEMGENEEIDVAPRHMAFVSIPAQKNLEQSSSYYEFDEDCGFVVDFDEESESNPESETEPDEEFKMDEEAQEKFSELESDLKDRLDSIQEEVASLKEGPEPEPDEGDGQSEAEARVSELEERLEQQQGLIGDLREKEAKRAAEEAGFEDDEEIEDLIELKEEDPVAFTRRLVKQARQTDESEFSGPKGIVGESDNGPDSEDLREKRRSYIESEYDATPGTERYYEKFEDEFGETPYSQ